MSNRSNLTKQRSSTKQKAPHKRLKVDASDSQDFASNKPNASRNRKCANVEILPQFTSLDALLENDIEQTRKEAVQKAKILKIQQERHSLIKNTSTIDTMTKERELDSIKAHISVLKSAQTGGEGCAQESFAYVFKPIKCPLQYVPFESKQEEKSGFFHLIYSVMESTDDEQLGSFLWSKSLMYFFTMNETEKKWKLPFRMCKWLYTTKARILSEDALATSFSFCLVALALHKYVSPILERVPTALFCWSPQDESLREKLKARLTGMEWRPSIYDFLQAFRSFGFQDNKGSMVARSEKEKLVETASAIPWPVLNMQYLMLFLLLCLRAEVLPMDDYDAFSFTLFFVKMQFEPHMHARIHQLALLCIETILELFPTEDWIKEWAPSLILRTAGEEGLFDTLTEWLVVVRSFPYTTRGILLKSALAVYVLQRQLDVSSSKTVLIELPADYVLQIINKVVQEYWEDVFQDPTSSLSLLDTFCKKVAFVDFALQAITEASIREECKALMQKLDLIVLTTKSTMNAKWYELKTLVTLMHRKYSITGS
uniref:Uncharacterized protein AlNc14C6G842 n=1 Tax=Albugo laibachii Nc14 TaxID=890382 RepID=F0W166_9STRA|nr:conserved hypothetical protein [Albugo laibachii Nc14]|eukprot:CCA14791.1 conserved hypothetical protein [Albugo laibachii Nc14]